MKGKFNKKVTERKENGEKSEEKRNQRLIKT